MFGGAHVTAPSRKAINDVMITHMSKSKLPGILGDRDVLFIVFQTLDQKSLASLALTCKFLKLAVYESLYENIFIYGETSSRKCSSLTHWHNNLNHPGWSVLHHHLQRKDSSVRLFERSLLQNKNLTKLIKRVATNDSAFILLNLDRWARFFSDDHQLRSLRFCNVSLLHFLQSNKFLADFYVTQNILRLICDLQVSHIQQLRSFVEVARRNKFDLKLKSLSFYSGDFEGEPNLEKDVVKIFDTLSYLLLDSMTGDSLTFLKQMQLFSERKLFPKVECLSLNQVHHDLSDILEFKIIEDSFEVERIRTWMLKIGCITTSTDSRVVIEDIINSIVVPCGCIETFLCNLLPYASIEKLNLQRQGPTLIEDPLNIYLFKQALDRFLDKLSRCQNSLRTLALDTQCDLIAPSDIASQNEVLRKSILLMNKSLMSSIKRLTLRKLVICDYFEAFTAWENSNYNPSKQSLLLRFAKHCNDCVISQRKFEDMISVNFRIQFYLDPFLNKGPGELDLDITRTFLRFLKNPSSAGIYEDEMMYYPSLDTPGFDCPYPSSFIENENWFLHEKFHHENYRDLVSKELFYSKRLKKPRKDYVVDCGCRGDEIACFSRLLAHGLDVKFPFRDVILNGLRT